MGLGQSPYDGTNLVCETNGMAHLPGVVAGSLRCVEGRGSAFGRVDKFKIISTLTSSQSSWGEHLHSRKLTWQ